MRRFLSHDKTKADLAKYHAEEVAKKNTKSSKLIIRSASGHTRDVYSAAILLSPQDFKIDGFPFPILFPYLR